MGEKGWERCPCLVLEINQQKLGALFTTSPIVNSPLLKLTDTNLVIDAPLATVREHVAGVLLADSKRSFITMDAYRLIEIFLDQDEEFKTANPTTETDLFILLMGFGDPRNKYLPELIIQVLSRRELTSKPTWVVLGIGLEQVGVKYQSAQLEDKLRTYKKVKPA